MTALTPAQALTVILRAYTGAPGYGDTTDEHGVPDWMNTAAAQLAAATDPVFWTWTPPGEPAREVRRVRPVERYAGDNAIWFDREDDGAGWRCFLRGRPGEPMDWLQVIAAAGSIYGGRTLVDATAERDAAPRELGSTRPAFDLSRIDYVLERVDAGLDLADAPVYPAEPDGDACTAQGGDPREVERLWPGRVKFLPGKDGLWIVDRRWAVGHAYPGWAAIDLHERENATIERASVGEPAASLPAKIAELIGAP